MRYWLLRDEKPNRFIIWLGGWLSLASRVRDLELRVVELERRLWKHENP